MKNRFLTNGPSEIAIFDPQDTPNGPQMAPKWTPNGSKLEHFGVDFKCFLNYFSRDKVWISKNTEVTKAL